MSSLIEARLNTQYWAAKEAEAAQAEPDESRAKPLTRLSASKKVRNFRLVACQPTVDGPCSFQPVYQSLHVKCLFKMWEIDKD